MQYRNITKIASSTCPQQLIKLAVLYIHQKMIRKFLFWKFQVFWTSYTTKELRAAASELQHGDNNCSKSTIKTIWLSSQRLFDYFKQLFTHMNIETFKISFFF